MSDKWVSLCMYALCVDVCTCARAEKEKGKEKEGNYLVIP